MHLHEQDEKGEGEAHEQVEVDGCQVGDGRHLLAECVPERSEEKV